MIKFMRKIGVAYLFSALISIVIGIVYIVWPQLTQKVFCVIAGSALIVFGLGLFIYHLASMKKRDYLMNEMIIGLILVLVGFLFIFKSEALFDILGTILGVVVVSHGLINIQESFLLKRCGNRKWFVFLLISFLFVIVGLIVLFVPGIEDAVFAILLGVSLVVAGLFEVIVFFILRKYVRELDDSDSETIVVSLDKKGSDDN